jgi:tetratricopeptide (TPR) repeat protein
LGVRVLDLERDIEMLVRLRDADAEIVFSAEGEFWNESGPTQRTADAFRRYGLDLKALNPEEAAKRVRASAIRDQLILALDTWANDARVADLADDDPWRRRLRTAKARQDREALKAMAQEEEALTRPPDQLLQLLNALAHDEWPTSEKLLSRAQPKHPNYYPFNTILGWGLLAKKQPPDPAAAARFCQAALAIQPRCPTDWYNLAKALEAQGDPAGAAEALRKVTELKPGEPESYFRLIIVLDKQGLSQEAERVASFVLDLAPEGARQQYLFAWHVVISRRLRARASRLAVSMAKQAVEQEPRNGIYWFALGAAQYHAGDWRAAAAALHQSMELRAGGDSYNWFFLAMTHWKMGQNGQALHWYEKATQWMEKSKLSDVDDLRQFRLPQFRAEAAELLGIPELPQKRDGPSGPEGKPQSKP